MKTINKTLLGLGVVLGLAAIGAAAAVYSGVYNVAADVPHSKPVYAALEIARERSIATRASRLQAPGDLADPARIRQGAGNYAAMCVACHLSPGVGESEMSKGLYPAPPDLARETVDAAEAFWVIKHGIKASGMPAWGKSMDDEYIWNMVAFLQELPKLDKAAYAAWVASSDGHSHGGGETGGHSHSGPGQDDHHAEAASGHSHDEAAPAHAHENAVDAKPATPTSVASEGHAHTHADGSSHVHASTQREAPTPTATPVPQPDQVESKHEADKAEEHTHDHPHEH